jgi:hypothetical protein
MAGKFNCTCNNGSKRNGGIIRNYCTHGSAEAKQKWRKNSATRASTGCENKWREIRNHMDQLKPKNGGKFSDTCIEGGKWRENPKPPASAEAKKWRKQRMAGYVLPELAASWARGLKVWTLVQVAVGSTHHLGVLQVALHRKQISGIGKILQRKQTLF